MPKGLMSLCKASSRIVKEVIFTCKKRGKSILQSVSTGEERKDIREIFLLSDFP